MMTKPELDWTKVLAGGMVLLGMLFFLVGLHVMTISTGGGVSQVLGTVFKVFLSLFVGCLLFGLVGVIIQLLRWLAWKVTTPEWKQNEVR